MSAARVTSKRCLVTGGAGFIGSHLVDRLLHAGNEVTVVDSLCSGWNSLYPSHGETPRLTLVDGDLCELRTLDEIVAGQDIVYHLAGQSNKVDVQREGEAVVQGALVAMWRLLEAVRANGTQRLVFASSQLVYGELERSPIKETSGPLLPMSLFGAGKLGCEALISAYSHLWGAEAAICRFSNVVGGRMSRGVVYDFIRKLRRSPQCLEILGDGHQRRSYLIVEDCVEAMLLVSAVESPFRTTVYNVGNGDTITAADIGRIVVETMGLRDVELRFTGGARGWPGDVPNVEFDSSRLRRLGWRPGLSSEQAVRVCAERLIAEGL